MFACSFYLFCHSVLACIDIFKIMDINRAAMVFTEPKNWGKSTFLYIIIKMKSTQIVCMIFSEGKKGDPWL